MSSWSEKRRGFPGRKVNGEGKLSRANALNVLAGAADTGSGTGRDDEKAVMAAVGGKHISKVSASQSNLKGVWERAGITPLLGLRLEKM